ncbi:MAG: prohibitin family protein [Erysipelotrichaceae bacterium]|nr:prohibitin family protein [Erysipelotrichaceae bacterium]
MIKTLLSIITILFILVSFVLLIYANSNTNKSRKVIDISKSEIKKKLNKISIIVLLSSILFGVLVPGSFHQVEAGQVAVVKRLGKVVKTRTPGTYFDFYLTNTYTFFDTTVQRIDIKTVSYSSDAQTMEIQMTVQYKIDASKAENILTEYLTMDSLSQRIEKVADDNVKSVLSKYTAMKIIETRASISPEVETIIKEAVGDRYFATITAVNLTNIDFTDEFEKAVEDKVVAEQQKEAAITKAKQELEVAKLTAQAKIEQARGDAESQKIIASASAEAMAIKIVELAKNIGFPITETYTKLTEVEVINALTNEVISSSSQESVVTTKPSYGVDVTNDTTNNTITTTTTTLVSTNYTIDFDANHTKDDLKVILDFVRYLEYLEKWDGKLPEVVSGTDGIEIIIPNLNESENTTNN